MSEHMGTWIEGNVKDSGVPTQMLVNLYENWRAGGWGILLTGNILIDPVFCIEFSQYSPVFRNTSKAPAMSTFRAKTIRQNCGSSWSNSQRPASRMER